MRITVRDNETGEREVWEQVPRMRYVLHKLGKGREMWCWKVELTGEHEGDFLVEDRYTILDIETEA